MAYLFMDNKEKVPVTATSSGSITVSAGTDYTTGKIRNIFFSTDEPQSADGSNGDIWIIYEESE